RCFDRVRLFDGNGGRDAPDLVHTRLVPPGEGLSHVRAESFDVTALPFGVNGLESETRLSAAARAGDDRQFAERKIDIDALEIVLARAANLNEVPRGRCNRAFLFSNP